MTEPDNPDQNPSGDPWWKPLAPEAPPTPPARDGDWWTPVATPGSEEPVPEPTAAPDPEPERASVPEPAPGPGPVASPSWDVDPAPEPAPAPAAAPTPEPEPVVDGPSGIDPDADPAPVADADDVAPDAEEDEPEEGGSRSGRVIAEWAAVIIGALVVALVVKTFLFQAFYIPSESMEPTLEKGDRVLVNKLSYDLHDVHRGDVIVFELDPEDVGADGIKDLIKRVIGLPGDTIETRDGVVYIDDRRLEEPYLPEGTKTGDPSSGTNPEIPRQVVPEGTVYVLGDNRDNSADSRYANRGPIPIDHIVGRAFVLVWPPQDISGL